MAITHPPRSGFENRSGRYPAILSSFVIHLAFLLLLACWAYVAGQPADRQTLSVAYVSAQEQLLASVETFELAVEESVSEQKDSPAQSLRLDVQVEPLYTPPAVPATPTFLAALTSASLTSSLGSGQPVEEVLSQDPKAGASFFGAYAEGRRFVYVLDSSTSMVGDRWVYACGKLLESLNGLTEEQEFFVICFDERTTLLFNLAPADARYFSKSDDMLEKIKVWLYSRTLGNNTKPAMALQYALKCEPDAIFLLSDGELKDNSIAMLRQLNPARSERRQIPIHTIHLFSRLGMRSLQTIAADNSGTFTPVGFH
ncbi:MAG: VWA domain-containing protein [Planctomycetales bacterium]|nr:VWA domain-containing protein [Planctomycetales bacterium]